MFYFSLSRPIFAAVTSLHVWFSVREWLTYWGMQCWRRLSFPLQKDNVSMASLWIPCQTPISILSFSLVWHFIGFVCVVIIAVSYVCNFPAVSRRHCFFVVTHLFMFLYVSFPFSTMILDLLEEGMQYIYLVMTENSEIFYSPHFGQLWACMLITICCKENLLRKK